MSNILSPVSGTRLPLCAIDADCQNLASAPLPAEWGDLDMNVPDPPVYDSTGMITIVDTSRNVPIPRFEFDMDNRSIGYFFLLVKRKYVFKH